MVCFSKPNCQVFRAGTLRDNLGAWRSRDLGDFASNVVEYGANIDIDDINPFYFNNRVFSRKQENFISQEIEDLLESDVIERSVSKPLGVSSICPIPKKGGKERLIINLKHLNSKVHPPKFQYEDINKVLSLAKYDDDIVTVDLKNGFYQVGVHDDLKPWLGFQFRNNYYQYKTLPFGANFSPYFFNKLLRPVIAYLRDRGLRVAIYVDDIILFASPSQIQEHTDILLETLSALGWQINREKSDLQPSKSKTFIGYRIITDGPGQCVWLKITSDKTQSLKHDIRRTIRLGIVTARFLAKVAGKCVAMSQAIMPAKLMLRNVYRLLAARDSWDSKLTLDEGSVSDLSWWIEAIHGWNGRAVSNRPIRHQLTTDASSTGWGAVLGEQEASGHWDREMSQEPSNVREMVAVLLGLQTFAQELSNSRVRIMTDNVSCAAYINFLGGTSVKLTNVARAIWEVAYNHNIELKAHYLAGSLNVHADRLSRVSPQYEWGLHRRLFQHLDRKWGPHSIDRFANMHNSQLPVYNSMYLDPQTSGVDALSQTNWGLHNNYVNAPFRLLDEVIQVIEEQGAQATVIAPEWKGQQWYRKLQKLSIEMPMRLPVSSNTIWATTPQPEPMKNAKWRLYAWRISGRKDL